MTTQNNDNANMLNDRHKWWVGSASQALRALGPHAGAGPVEELVAGVLAGGDEGLLHALDTLLGYLQVSYDDDDDGGDGGQFPVMATSAVEALCGDDD
jgi:hypothetical protein